jgi:predicted metal-dependent enzyme (double-stranded beta helix superfamily)
MAGSAKKRTTMAKLTRESRLRERRLDKRAKKDARKLSPAQDSYSPGDILSVTTGESDRTGSAPDGLEPVVQTHPDS